MKNLYGVADSAGKLLSFTGMTNVPLLTDTKEEAQHFVDLYPGLALKAVSVALSV